MKPDQVDLKIINCLEQDGRMAYAAIAKQVELISIAVGQRVQKMIDEGLIVGFGVQLNREKLGINVQAIISLKLNFSKIDAFQKILVKYPEVEYCYRVTGEDCIVMKVNLRDHAHLLDFINRISDYGFSKTNIIIDHIV